MASRPSLPDWPRLIAEHGRAIAKARGLAFIRFEHLKQEFGRP